MTITDMTVDASGQITLGGDLTVNRMGFGAIRVTGQGIWGPPDDVQESKRVLRRAVELGVNFIDTADSYGPEVSENLIAETLHPYPEGLVIATKGGLLRPGPGSLGSGREARASARRTRRKPSPASVGSHGSLPASPPRSPCSV